MFFELLIYTMSPQIIIEAVMSIKNPKDKCVEEMFG